MIVWMRERWHGWRERRIEKMAKQTYPETVLLRQVKGVGDLIATAYVLTSRTRIDSGRVATPDVLRACSLGAGTRGRANHRCALVRKGTNIYGRC